MVTLCHVELNVETNKIYWMFVYVITSQLWTYIAVLDIGLAEAVLNTTDMSVVVLDIIMATAVLKCHDWI